MVYLKAFVSGIVIPATLLQILGLLEAIVGWPAIGKQLFVHQLPVIWSLWNIAYFAYFKNLWPKNEVVSYLVHGLVLGALLAAVAVFVLSLPEALGFKGESRYLPLGIAPILYALVWAYGVRPLNRAFGLVR